MTTPQDLERRKGDWLGAITVVVIVAAVVADRIGCSPALVATLGTIATGCASSLYTRRSLLKSTAPDPGNPPAGPGPSTPLPDFLDPTKGG